MASRTETALLRLHAALVAGATPEEGPDPDRLRIPKATRNLDVARVLEVIEAPGGAVRTALNLRDGTTQVINEILGADGEMCELEHRADLEWLVSEVLPERRDAAFDAGVMAVCDMIDSLRSAEGCPALLPLHAEGETEEYAVVRLVEVMRSGHIFDGVAQMKSCVMVITLTFLSRYPV